LRRGRLNGLGGNEPTESFTGRAGHHYAELSLRAPSFERDVSSGQPQSPTVIGGADWSAVSVAELKVHAATEIRPTAAMTAPERCIGPKPSDYAGIWLNRGMSRDPATHARARPDLSTMGSVSREGGGGAGAAPRATRNQPTRVAHANKRRASGGSSADWRDEEREATPGIAWASLFMVRRSSCGRQQEEDMQRGMPGQCAGAGSREVRRRELEADAEIRPDQPPGAYARGEPETERDAQVAAG
jgi:hypothetical protein